MTEAQQKSLKIIKREIDGLRPRQKWFDRELDIINTEMIATHAAIMERPSRSSVRSLLPRWSAVGRRFDHYQSEFKKFSQKIAGLRVRVDAIDKDDIPPEEIKLLTDAFTALLDGQHRLKAAEKLSAPGEI